MDFDTLKCQIEYDGPALKEHTIDVNQLAPALLAFSEAMTKISKHVSPEKSAICNVKIKAFKEGCFISDLIIETIQEHGEEIAGVMGTIMASGGSNIQVLFKILLDVFKATLFRKKHTDQQVTINYNIDNSVTYEIKGNGNIIQGDQSKLTISKYAHEIIEEGKIASEMKNIVNPLTEDRINDLHIHSLPEDDNKALEFHLNVKEKDHFYDADEIKIMWVKVRGFIENMHKKYRTFGLVDKRSKYACYIPKEENLSKYAELFTDDYVEIEGEAEVSSDNVIQKIKVTNGRKLQMDIYDSIEANKNDSN